MDSSTNFWAIKDVSKSFCYFDNLPVKETDTDLISSILPASDPKSTLHLLLRSGIGPREDFFKSLPSTAVFNEKTSQIISVPDSYEEIALIEKTIAECIINETKQFFNKNEESKGLWYPEEYNQYLIDKYDEEMAESMYTGFANEEFFDKFKYFTFTLKDGKKPSEALNIFFEGPTGCCCANTNMAIYYKVILNILGPEKFNQIFSQIQYCLTISYQGIAHKTSMIRRLVNWTDVRESRGGEGVLGKRPLKIGEECFFSGVKWMDCKHPKGHRGWYVIYIGDDEKGNQLFVGQGLKKPLTEDEINQVLVEEYNHERTLQDEQYIIELKNSSYANLKDRYTLEKIEFIESLRAPATEFDKETNPYLKDHYIISKEEVGQNPSKFLGGFFPYVARLRADRLLELKNSDYYLLLMSSYT